VFLIYGMHECYNVVTGEHGEPEAVLLRALEPLPGTARCDGPGRLTRALGIDRRHNGSSLVSGPIAIEESRELALCGGADLGADSAKPSLQARPDVAFAQITDGNWNLAFSKAL